MTGELYDAPNQQVVRADGSAPWDEGEGGSPGDATAAPTAVADQKQSDLDDMTKEQLLGFAQEIGASPANAAMSKAEIRESIDRKVAEA